MATTIVSTRPSGGNAQPAATQLTALSNQTSTGFYVVTGAGTGTTLSFLGTANEIDVANGTGLTGNPTFSLADNAIFPGNGAITVPVGTNLQYPATPVDGMIRYNSTSHLFEFHQNGVWVNLATGVAGVAQIVAGSGITISPAGGTGIVTINSTGGGGSGTVTSVGLASTTLTITGSPITTSGTFTANLPATGVAPGSYTNADITVDQYGRIIAASNGAASGVSQIIAGSGVTISPVGGTGAVTINATGSGTSLQLYKENPVAPSAPSATGINSIALLSASSATAQDSLAIGVQSVARIQGGVVQASGRFGTSGDAQVGRYTVRTVTVNNIATEMFVDGTGGSVRLVLPDDATWTFRATITGHRTDASDGHAGFTIEGVIYRVAGPGSVAIQGKPSIDRIAAANTSWSVAVAADTTNGSLMFTVTGQNSKVIRWLALVETVEITN